MRDENVPVSLKLLDLRIAEVKGEVTTHRLETKAEFSKIDARFDRLERRFDESQKAFDARFDESQRAFDAKFDDSMKIFNAKFDESKKASDAKFDESMKLFNAKFDEMMNFSNAKFEALRTEITKNQAIVEEQNARNRFALDGYAMVYEKMVETDTRIARIEKHIFGA